jgi:hypothetical protein
LPEMPPGPSLPPISLLESCIIMWQCRSLWAP